MLDESRLPLRSSWPLAVASVLGLHADGFLAGDVLLVGDGDPGVLDDAEDRDVSADRLVVVLAVGMVVDGDDAVDLGVEVLERLADLLAVGRARLLDGGGEEVDRVIALRGGDRRRDAVDAVALLIGLDERLALRRVG